MFRKAIIISFILHAVLLSLLVIIPQYLRPRINPLDIVEVTLINNVQSYTSPPPKSQQVQPAENPYKLEQKKKLQDIAKLLEKKRKNLDNLKPVPTVPEIEKTVSTPVPTLNRVLPTPKPEAREGTGILVDSKTFSDTRYLLTVQNSLKRYWNPPPEPIATRKKRVVVIGFKILKNGKVDGIKVERSSGRDVLDDAAVMAVRNSAPFMPLPYSFEEEKLGIHVPFVVEP